VDGTIDAGYMRRRRARVTFLAVSLLWLLVVGGGIAVQAAQVHDNLCDSPSRGAGFDSTLGTPHFRWSPLGVECVYTHAANGVDRRDEPGPIPSAWAIVSLVLTIAVIRSFVATRNGVNDEEALDRSLG
jgi:hypothetical protein